MEGEPLNVIRESTRKLLQLNRQHRRDEISDNNRSINVTRITPDRVIKIAQNLKAKSSITAADLHILKNGLMDDANNISVVLSTDGALRGLVRELTGNDAERQVAAASCLCNLAIADGKTCRTIAKASSIYLIIALDSFITELVVTCAWTLGNLAGSSSTVCELLIAQGAVTKLCDLLTQCDEDIQDATLYALVHIAYQLKDQLRVDYLKRILQELTKIELTMSSSQLLFILSCHRDFPENLTEDLAKKVLIDMPDAMKTHLSTCKNDKKNVMCCKLIHVVRVLGNMDMRKMYNTFLDTLLSNNMSEDICRILNADNKTVLRDSLIWLLGNMYNLNSDNVFFYNILHSNCRV